MFNYEQFLKFVPDTLSIVVGLARVTPASLNTDKAQQAKKTLTFGAHSLWWCLKMHVYLEKVEVWNMMTKITSCIVVVIK